MPLRMENRIGKNLPNDTELAALEKRLTDLIADVRKFAITLAPEERTTRIRPQHGFAEQARLIADLSTQYGVTLTEAPLSEIALDIAASAKLRRLGTLSTVLDQMLWDSEGQAMHECAQGTYLHYGVLSSLAPHKPELAAALRPVKTFFTPVRKRAAAADPKDGAGDK